MFFSLRLFFVTALLSVALLAQDSISVTFRVVSPTVKSGEKVCISGNNEKLGSWDPGSIQLQSKGNGVFELTLHFAKKEKLEYKFTKGSWQEEAQFEKGVTPSNLHIVPENDTVVTAVVPDWGGMVTIPHGQITGEVRYHRNIAGPGIQARDIIVWLPPDYEKNKKKHYPVLYMHDGQNIVDPKTCGFGYDWEVDEHADSLIRCGAMEPIIVVGIYCTAARTIEYSPGDTGTNYMKFLVNVVKPMIDKAYRTKPQRENTAIGGSSMGGLISFMLAWEYPDVFSKAICFSPALKIWQFDYVKTVKATKERKNVFLYMYNGGVGLETMLRPGIDEMISALKEKNYVEGKDFVFIVDPEAEHNERAWAKQIGQALVKLFGK
jgi:predicted alpha/beta superfamily hydrolase